MRQGDAGLNESYYLGLISDAANAKLKEQGKTPDQITTILLAEVSRLGAALDATPAWATGSGQAASGYLFGLLWPCGATRKQRVCTHDSESVREVSMFGSRTRRRSRGDRFAECIVRTLRVDAMAVLTAYKYKVRAALMQFAKTGLFPHYSDCGFGTYGPGKDVLDEISREETRNGRPDITFVLRSKTTGYPSQIGFKSAKPPDDTQKVQARTEAQRLIDAYAPAGTRNPYG
jgi:hypothetical protein